LTGALTIDSYSHVLHGSQQKLHTDHRITHSPVTLCLEPKGSNLTELLIVALEGQVLQRTKLFNPQAAPGKLIVFNTELGNSKTSLVFKGYFGRPSYEVNKKGFLIATPSDSEEEKADFNEAGKICFSHKLWQQDKGKNKKKGKRKGLGKREKSHVEALTVLDIYADLAAGILRTDYILFERLEKDEECDEVEEMTMADCRKWVDLRKLTLYADDVSVTTLNFSLVADE
jgi:hypothetical protein